jgi:hypothetical protein
MKKLAVALLFLSTAMCWAAKPVNPAGYPVKIRIMSSHLQELNGPLIVNALIGDKHYELMSLTPLILDHTAAVLVPGDYFAKVLPRKETKPYLDVTQYEMLFPDGTTAIFNVTGRPE